MAKVTWSFNAASDLQNIETYISEEAKAPLNAIRFIDSLIDHTETILAIQPYSGRSAHELENSTYDFLKEIIFKGYRIVYDPRLAPIEVIIISVQSGRMDLPKKAKEWDF